MHTTLRFSAAWDAPFDRVEIDFRYFPGTPATGPSYSCAGEPAEPASVDPLRCTVTVAGARHEAPDWLRDAFAAQFEGEMLDLGRECEGEECEFQHGRAA